MTTYILKHFNFNSKKCQKTCLCATATEKSQGTFLLWSYNDEPVCEASFLSQLRASQRSALDRRVLDMKDFASLHAQDEHRILIWTHMRLQRRKSFILNC